MADNQNIPFDILISQMKIHQEKSRNPLFGTLLVYQNSLVQKVNIDGINFDLEVLTNETSKFDLSIQIFEEQNKLLVRFEYNSAFFNEETIEKWQKEYKCIVENIMQTQQRKFRSGISFLRRKKIEYYISLMTHMWNFQPIRQL